MSNTYGRYIVIVPAIAMNLDLLPFGKRYTWMKCWDDLCELNEKIIGEQIKIFTYVEDPKREPTKLFLCTLIDSRSEEDAYEKGMAKIEEFLSLITVFLRRSFEVLTYEVTTLPLPNVRSLKEVELHVDGGYLAKVSSPKGNWTMLSPHFGEITNDTIFPVYFELPKMEGKVSGTQTVIRKKDFDEVEDFFVKIDRLSKEERGFLKVIGQLYSTAISTEAISISYLLLWEILEVYSHTLSTLTQLLDKQKLSKVRKFLKQEKYEDTERIVSWLGMLGEQTETQVISTIIQKDLFPKKKIDEVNTTITALRKTRNMITHPKVLSNIDNATLLDHYQKLKEIVDKLLIHLCKSYE